MKRYYKIILLVFISSIILLLGGCVGGVGSANFDLGKFFSNPLVIFAVIGIIIWLWAKDRKK